jgi:hypothetical protein
MPPRGAAGLLRAGPAVVGRYARPARCRRLRHRALFQFTRSSTPLRLTTMCSGFTESRTTPGMMSLPVFTGCPWRRY